MHHNLDIYLKDANLSKVARELGISKSLLSDWVSSRRSPSLKNVGLLKKLADYVGLTLEELLLGKDSREEGTVITSLLFQDENRNYSIKIKRMK